MESPSEAMLPAPRCQISSHGSGEGCESDDSEGENQELAQIDRERRRNCALTPLATSQQHNQGPLSPSHLRRLRLLLDANTDRHSSEDELERISRIGEGRKWAFALHQHHGDHHSSASSDEEVRDLPLVEQPGGRLVASPSPVLFSSSPPHSLKPPLRFQLPAVRPIILTHFDQSAVPYRKNRHSYGGEPRRPSLDLEKMQQKMLLLKNCGGKTRSIKIRVHLRSVHLCALCAEPRPSLQPPDALRGALVRTLISHPPLTPSEDPSGGLLWRTGTKEGAIQGGCSTHKTCPHLWNMDQRRYKPCPCYWFHLGNLGNTREAQCETIGERFDVDHQGSGFILLCANGLD
ncbi:hypothetical protein NHX12_019773 [Muraenolepis orangiensis]|uniref:Uncharacterized protein n=1 Tax=Muraenolepis orangiensis TaxID=630683 RepID=A0A9Q0IXR6_9TELE|nr:hypothetical protein NHX12_019773 [Muraenolepis orangiensis]